MLFQDKSSGHSQLANCAFELVLRWSLLIMKIIIMLRINVGLDFHGGASKNGWNGMRSLSNLFRSFCMNAEVNFKAYLGL